MSMCSHNRRTTVVQLVIAIDVNLRHRLFLSYFMQASELHLQLLKYSSQLSNCHFPLQLSNTRVVCDEYLTSPYHT